MFERDMRVALREPLVARALEDGVAARTSRSHHYVFYVLPHGFSKKRETARSLWKFLSLFKE